MRLGDSPDGFNLSDGVLSGGEDAAVTPPEHIADVIRRLEAIEASAPATDGVVCFARLYREVTVEVAADVARRGFEETRFLEALDVRFAGLFFSALESYGRAPGSTPSAWVPLFAQRSRRGVAPLQFALAGMNAHINRDLPVALVATCRELRLELGDCVAGARRLRAREHAALRGRATGEELVRHRLAGLGRPARAPAATASTTSWRCGTWSGRATQPGRTRRHSGRSACEPPLAGDYLLALDRMVGLASRGLLIPADSLLLKLARAVQ